MAGEIAGDRSKSRVRYGPAGTGTSFAELSMLPGGRLLANNCARPAAAPRELYYIALCFAKK